MDHTVILGDEISKIGNACALSALKALRSDLEDSLIIETFRKHGFHSKGIPHGAEKKVLRELGIGYIETELREDHQITLFRFCQDHPEGSFMVHTRKHYQAVINGIPVDPYFGRPKMRATVDSFIRILDPVPIIPAKKRVLSTDRIRLVSKTNPKHHESSAYARYYEMARLVEGGVRTVRDILTKTGYTRADLNNDLAKGHIAVE